ncbi:MAG: hypothetical protein ACRD0S_01435 [Acidimicrobiales bacterium]
MSDGYVLAGYGITVGTLGLYAARVLWRGRALSRSARESGPGGGPVGRSEPEGTG